MKLSTFQKSLPRLVGELAIIIVGVIIALWAENWLQDQSRAAEARSTATLLVSELEADSTNLARLRNRLPARDTAAAKLLSGVQTSGYPADSALTDLWTLRFHTAYAPSRASFERLVQSEGLRHVGPPLLQTRTMAYFQESQAVVVEMYGYFNDQQDAFTRSMSRHVIPTPSSLEEALGACPSNGASLVTGTTGARSEAAPRRHSESYGEGCQRRRWPRAARNPKGAGGLHRPEVVSPPRRSPTMPRCRSYSAQVQDPRARPHPITRTRS